MLMTEDKKSTSKQVRNERIAVQVTPEEKLRIEQLAQQKGLNMSAYVRMVLSDLAKK